MKGPEMCDIEREYEELCRRIDEHELISFDIYDTLVLRNVVHPTDLFELVHRELRQQGATLGTKKSFKELRIRSERMAREQSRREDVTLDEIYESFSRKAGDSVSDQAKRLELALEQKFTIANPFMKRVYDYSIAAGKRVILISDMYLPSTWMKEMLATCGYVAFEALFVSGEIGKSKGSGSMYEHVRGELNNTDSWLHIGDNLVSDYQQAKNYGVNAYYYKDTRLRANVKPSYSIEQSIMKAIQINMVETTSGLSYWEKFGIRMVSPILYGFTTWLARQLKGKDNVYFLSRDGYLPFLIYNKFREHDEDLPEARYIYASRRGYQVPNALHLSKEELFDVLTAYNPGLGQKLQLAEIFDNLRLDKNIYREQIKEFGFKEFSDFISGEGTRNRAKSVLNAIYEDISSVLKREQQLAIDYLRQNGIYSYSEINLVDIGWAGSTQKAIQQLTGLPTRGFYLGTSNSVYPEIADRVNSYAFQLGKPSAMKRSIMDNVMMYEFIFSAPHGSLVGFRYADNLIVPNVKDTEGNEAVLNALHDIQGSVLKMVEEYERYAWYLTDLSPDECLKDYLAFIKAKKYEDLVAFSELSAVVGIGDSKSKQTYVSVISRNTSQRDKKATVRQSSMNLWRGAVVDMDNSSGRVDWKHKLYRMGLLSEANRLMRLCIRAIYNPKKAIRMLLKKVIG